MFVLSRKNLFLFFVFLVLTPCKNIYAIDLNNTPNSNYKIPVVDKTDSSLFNNLSTTVITGEMIRRSGAKTIPQALKMIPGFVNAMPFGNYEIAAYGGIQDEYPRATKIEINGVPVNLASTGSVFWESLPISIEDVQRISFTSTPDSAINGDQSFNGVIKIFTFRADENVDLLSLTVGNKSNKRAYFRKSVEINDLTNLQVAVSKKENDGALNLISDSSQKKAWVNLSYFPDNKNRVYVDLGYGKSDDDKHSDPNLFYIPNYGNRKIEQKSATLSWKNSSHGELSGVLGVISIDNKLSNIVEDNTYLFDISYQSIRKFGSLTYNNSLSESTDYQLYGGFKIDDETPNTFSRTKDRWLTEQSEFSAMLNTKIYKDVNAILAAGRSSHSLFDNEVSYLSSISKRISSKESISLTYSQGVRFPVNWESRSEHYITAISVPGLKIVRNNSSPENVKPEKVENYSIKYDFIKSFDKKISVSIFHKHYHDLLYQQFEVFNDGVGLYPGNTTNNSLYGDEIDTNGLELNSQWRFNKNLDILLSYAFNNAYQENKGLLDMKNSIPRHVLFFMANKAFPGNLDLGLSYSYVSTLSWEKNTVNSVDKITKPYSTIGVNASKCYNSGRIEKLCVSANASHLLEPVSTLYNSDTKEGIGLEGLKLDLNLKYIF